MRDLTLLEEHLGCTGLLLRGELVFYTFHNASYSVGLKADLAASGKMRRF